MPGTLYVVATPIGNLADITLRALSVLREVDLIAAEDTRVTHNLLRHYEIDTPMTPYHQHSLGRKAQQLLGMLQQGKSIAIVSDAGTPGISDPGHEIITLCIQHDVPVVSIPGPAAIISALVVSGLSTRRFIFEGFPPRRQRERISYLEAMKTETRTMVFYESPHRVLTTLRAMLDAWGDRPVAVARELTKMFEEIHRGTLTSAIERFTAVAAKGEICIVVSGVTEPSEPTATDEIEDAIQEAMDSGISDRDAVHQVAEAYSVPKKEVYRRMLDMKRDKA